MRAKKHQPGSHKHLRKAYCIELGEVVNIIEARRRFAERADKSITGFTFLCWSKACKDHNIVISGVLYQVPPEEAHLRKAAHFRLKDMHRPGCAWLGAASDEDDGEGDNNGSEYPGESDAVHVPGASRRALQKDTSLITIFDPRTQADRTPTTGEAHTLLVHVGGDGDNVSAIALRAKGSDERSETRTSDLSLLVDSYLYAREHLTLEEFRKRRLRVVGIGTLYLHEYFVHMAHATLNTHNRVLFGGAKYLRPYGTAGFKFEFFDNVDGQVVTLYAASNDVAAYPYREALHSRIMKARNRRYVTIYATGHLVANLRFGTIDLVIPNLDHVEFILGPPKDELVTVESSSEDHSAKS